MGWPDRYQPLASLSHSSHLLSSLGLDPRRLLERSERSVLPVRWEPLSGKRCLRQPGCVSQFVGPHRGRKILPIYDRLVVTLSDHNPMGQGGWYIAADAMKFEC